MVRASCTFHSGSRIRPKFSHHNVIRRHDRVAQEWAWRGPSRQEREVQRSRTRCASLIYVARGPSAAATAAGMALSTLLLRLQRAGKGPFSSLRTERSREEARPRSRPQRNDQRSREGSPRRPRRGDLATSSSPRWSRGHVGRHARGRMEEEGSPVGHAAVPSRLGGRGTPKGRCAVSTACHGWRVPRLTVAHANRLADTSASASGQHNNVFERPMKGHHGPWLGTAKSSRPSSGVWVVEASTVQYRVYTLAR